MDQEAVITEMPSTPPPSRLERGSEQKRDELGYPVWDDDLKLNEIVSSSERDEVLDHMGLTSRQKDLIALLLLGWSDQQISEKLGIAVGTVTVHMGILYKKYRVSSRTQLVLLFFRELRRKSSREIHAFSEDLDQCDCPYISRKSTEERSRQILNEIWPEFEPILTSTGLQQGTKGSAAREKNYLHALVYESLTGNRWDGSRPTYFPCHQALRLRLKTWFGLRNFCEAWQKVMAGYSLWHSPNPDSHADYCREGSGSITMQVSSDVPRAHVSSHSAGVSGWPAVV